MPLPKFRHPFEHDVCDLYPTQLMGWVHALIWDTTREENNEAKERSANTPLQVFHNAATVNQ